MNTYKYHEIYIGMKEEFTICVTDEKVRYFKEITGDINPLHNDSEYAKGRGYADKVAFGMLTGSFLSTLAGVYLPGERSLIHSVEIKFSNPVIVGDNLKIVGEVTDKNDLFKIIILKVEIFKLGGADALFEADSLKVLRGRMQIGVL